MPFKYQADHRNHIPKPRYRVTNWAEYDASLQRRGSLTVWFTDEAVAAWRAEPRTTPGGQPHYSALAITTALTMHMVFGLGLRQTEGLIGSIIGLLGLDLAVPDHSTLSRRGKTLEMPPLRRTSSGPLHLLVDSTGLKLGGAGEWLIEKHGTARRRSWRKLHIGVDADSGEIVAVAVTRKEVDHAAMLGGLLGQIAEPVASFTADGDYDQDRVYHAVTEHHPDAAVIVPPRASAVLSGSAETAPTQRDGHLRTIAERGRMAWQKSSGYNLRAKVEASIGRLQARDRRCASLAHGPDRGNRGGHRRGCAEPDVGVRTPELCPYRVNNGIGVGVLRPRPVLLPICATQSRGRPGRCGEDRPRTAANRDCGGVNRTGDGALAGQSYPGDEERQRGKGMRHPAGQQGPLPGRCIRDVLNTVAPARRNSVANCSRWGDAFGLTRIGIPSFIMTLARPRIATGVVALLVRGQIACNVPLLVLTVVSRSFGPAPWIVIAAALFLLVGPWS